MNPGMFTVQDVIHLIQYYYHTSSWEGAAADVEQIRLQSIRGQILILTGYVTTDQQLTRYRESPCRPTSPAALRSSPSTALRRVPVLNTNPCPTVTSDR